jgi:hypothetical protein
LDSIFRYCDTLSKEELTKIIIGMAKDVSTSGRVVFLEKLESFLTVVSGHSEKSGTIKALLKGYANKTSAYSGRISIEDGMDISFYEEIIKGLNQKEETKSKTSEYLSWAEKIGKGRIDHIVSNKHRNAYGRAAQVVGSLAETYASMDQKSKAVKILHKYYNEKYNRFPAFRREVKAVVLGSGLLRNLGFLT